MTESDRDLVLEAVADGVLEALREKPQLNAWAVVHERDNAIVFLAYTKEQAEATRKQLGRNVPGLMEPLRVIELEGSYALSRKLEIANKARRRVAAKLEEVKPVVGGLWCDCGTPHGKCSNPGRLIEATFGRAIRCAEHTPAGAVVVA